MKVAAVASNVRHGIAQLFPEEEQSGAVAPRDFTMGTLRPRAFPRFSRFRQAPLDVAQDQRRPEQTGGQLVDRPRSAPSAIQFGLSGRLRRADPVGPWVPTWRPCASNAGSTLIQGQVLDFGLWPAGGVSWQARVSPRSGRAQEAGKADSPLNISIFPDPRSRTHPARLPLHPARFP